MKKGGTGGANTNKSGLKFERRIDVKTAFEGLNGYEVKDNEVFFDGKKVAELYQKYDLYKKLPMQGIGKNMVNKLKIGKKTLKVSEEVKSINSKKITAIIQTKVRPFAKSGAYIPLSQEYKNSKAYVIVLGEDQ